MFVLSMGGQSAHQYTRSPRKPDDTTADADITYKQAQRVNPKRDEERVAAKKKRLPIS
jgi:hypothetical protein